MIDYFADARDRGRKLDQAVAAARLEALTRSEVHLPA